MMTTEQRLLEAEQDLQTLLDRSSNALPTLKRVAEDATDWRHDIRTDLYANLQKAVDEARERQAKRRHNWPSGGKPPSGNAPETA
jgi:hypothetical protein